MFKELLLVGAALLANGSVLTLKTPQKAVNPNNSNNFRYFSNLFPDYEAIWSGPNSLTAYVTINESLLMNLPNLDFNVIYFGDFHINYDIEEFYFTLMSDYDSIDSQLPIPSSGLSPFVFYSDYADNPVYSKGFIASYTSYRFSFYFAKAYNQSAVINDFESNIGMANTNFIEEYVFMVASDYYTNGVSDGEATAEGGWLGNLVFGTVGGIVGFLFAISDFEVLGVSIMSIITLFVAIGIIIMLLKVIK